MLIAGFKAMNQRALERGERTFVNPRNAAAGSIRQLDPRLAADRPFDVFFYGVGETDGWKLPARHSEALQQLREWGLKVSPLLKIVQGAEGCLQYYRDIGAKRAEPAVRDRRRRLQGQSLRPAARARLRSARAALGDRAQVPGARREHDSQRRGVPGRADRRADAGRAAGAGVRRRRDGQQRDAAQHGRSASQGRAHRRHRRHPPRRRRDSGSREGHRRAPSEDAPPKIELPAKCPDLQLGGGARRRAKRSRVAPAACTVRPSAKRRCATSPAGARSTSTASAARSSTSWSRAIRHWCAARPICTR